MKAPLRLTADELTQLLERELSAGHVDENGWTDLHYLAVLDLPKQARCLLRLGAAADARLKADGEQLDGTVLKVLRRAGLTFRTWEREGDQPLHLAAWSNSVATVETLIELGAEVHGRIRSGSTALHVAARFDAEASARALLRHGAEVGDRDERGWTPLHAAVRNDAYSTARLLLDEGAPVNARGERGLTPLHFAVIGDAPNVRDTPRFARLLLDHGAHVNAVSTDEFRITPLDLAETLEMPVTAALLRRHGGDVTMDEKHELVGVVKRPLGPDHGVMFPVVRRTVKRRKPRTRRRR